MTAETELAQLIRDAGLTQAQAAAELGIGLRTLQRYLSGQRAPSEPVMRLARYILTSRRET